MRVFAQLRDDGHIFKVGKADALGACIVCKSTDAAAPCLKAGAEKRARMKAALTANKKRGD
jgi:hypothetical protein